MFDISWSEFLLIGVVALVVIGPKELPGVLRMIGQWMGKARKMATEFQGQFNEAMREAEMADLKKSFDEVKEAASGLTRNNLMTSLHNDVTAALGEPAKTDTASTPTSDIAVMPTTPEPPTPATFAEAEAHGAVSEPLAITRESAPVVPAAIAERVEVPGDAKTT